MFNNYNAIADLIFGTSDIDIETTKDGYVVEIELPGAKKESIQVRYQNRIMDVLYQNKKGSTLRKQIYLGINVDPKRSTGKYEDGVLTVEFLTKEKDNDLIKIT